MKPAAGCRRTVILMAVASMLAACSALPGRDFPACSPGTAMQKHELYFGLTRGGERIDDAQWRDFLASEVTPRPATHHRAFKPPTPESDQKSAQTGADTSSTDCCAKRSR